MKFLKNVKKFGAGIALSGLAVTNSNAALDVATTTALDTAKTDAGEAGGLITGIIVSVVAIFLVIGVLKKAG